MSKYDFVLKHLDEHILSYDKRSMYHPASNNTMTFVNYEMVIDIIKELLAERAWHPYPAEKPEKDGVYIVTIINCYDEDNLRHRMISEYYVSYDKWDCESARRGCRVIAWRELPEPYKEPK